MFVTGGAVVVVPKMLPSQLLPWKAGRKGLGSSKEVRGVYDTERWNDYCSELVAVFRDVGRKEGWKEKPALSHTDNLIMRSVKSVV